MITNVPGIEDCWRSFSSLLAPLRFAQPDCLRTSVTLLVN
jgi:hypothetical protein